MTRKAKERDGAIFIHRERRRWWNEVMRDIADDKGVSVQDMIYEDAMEKYADHPRMKECIAAEETLEQEGTS